MGSTPEIRLSKRRQPLNKNSTPKCEINQVNKVSKIKEHSFINKKLIKFVFFKKTIYYFIYYYNYFIKNIHTLFHKICHYTFGGEIKIVHESIFTEKQEKNINEKKLNIVIKIKKWCYL